MSKIAVLAKLLDILKRHPDATRNALVVSACVTVLPFIFRLVRRRNQKCFGGDSERDKERDKLEKSANPSSDELDNDPKTILSCDTSEKNGNSSTLYETGGFDSAAETVRLGSNCDVKETPYISNVCDLSKEISKEETTPSGEHDENFPGRIPVDPNSSSDKHLDKNTRDLNFGETILHPVANIVPLDLSENIVSNKGEAEAELEGTKDKVQKSAANMNEVIQMSSSNENSSKSLTESEPKKCLTCNKPKKYLPFCPKLLRNSCIRRRRLQPGQLIFDFDFAECGLMVDASFSPDPVLPTDGTCHKEFNKHKSSQPKSLGPKSPVLLDTKYFKLKDEFSDLLGVPIYKLFNSFVSKSLANGGKDGASDGKGDGGKGDGGKDDPSDGKRGRRKRRRRKDDFSESPETLKSYQISLTRLQLVLNDALEDTLGLRKQRPSHSNTGTSPQRLDALPPTIQFPSSSASNRAIHNPSTIGATDAPLASGSSSLSTSRGHSADEGAFVPQDTSLASGSPRPSTSRGHRADEGAFVPQDTSLSSGSPRPSTSRGYRADEGPFVPQDTSKDPPLANVNVAEDDDSKYVEFLETMIAIHSSDATSDPKSTGLLGFGATYTSSQLTPHRLIIRRSFPLPSTSRGHSATGGEYVAQDDRTGDPPLSNVNVAGHDRRSKYIKFLENIIVPHLVSQHLGFYRTRLSATETTGASSLPSTSTGHGTKGSASVAQDNSKGDSTCLSNVNVAEGDDSSDSVQFLEMVIIDKGGQVAGTSDCTMKETKARTVEGKLETGRSFS